MRQDDEQFIREVEREKNSWYYKLLGWLPKMKESRQTLDDVISDTGSRIARINQQLQKLEELKVLFEDLKTVGQNRASANDKFNETRGEVDNIVRKRVLHKKIWLKTAHFLRIPLDNCRCDA